MQQGRLEMLCGEVVWARVQRVVVWIMIEQETAQEWWWKDFLQHGERQDYCNVI